MASETLSNMSRSQREYLLRISEEKYILDTKSKRIQAWRKGLAEGKAEGIAEGMTLGRAEGIAVGKAEGLDQGIEKGKAEEKAEIAQKMKLMGFSDEQIQAVTGISDK
jgi:flagellar biosynthesis/type III secretory pathway protein FliH